MNFKIIHNATDLKSKNLDLRIDLNKDVLGQLSIPLMLNYYDSFNKPLLPKYTSTINEYFASSDAAELLCPEFPAHDILATAIHLTLPNSLDDARQHGKNAVALLHVGKSPCMAQLHFDWDHDYVLHACLTGNKTFFLIPPGSTWLLSPIINTSSLCLPRFSPNDQNEILGKLGGQKIELGAGEAVLFPSLWWHAVSYKNDSVAVSIRFGGKQYLRPFCALPRSWLLQRLIWHIFNNDLPDMAGQLLKDSLETFLNSSLSWQTRYESLQNIYRHRLTDTGHEQGAYYLTGNTFNGELALASKELETLYTLPDDSQRNSIVAETLRQVSEYLFSEINIVPRSMQEKFTVYALTKRQGLPSSRGIVGLV